jgi:predicted DsbA family dithiol-disulfide isomerase
LDAQLTELGAEAGLGFRYDLMTRTPNTLKAHRLIWLAGQDGNQDAMAETLFRAYFVQGHDIGDLGILTDIAVRSGIDRARAVAFLESNEGTTEVRKYEDMARAAGITGVPAFIANRRPLLMGAQSPEIIASALQSVLADAQI